jgi:hypothetical protein
LRGFGRESSQLKLERTADRLKRVLEYVTSAKGIDLCEDNTLKHEIKVLREALEDDLTKVKIYIPSFEQAKYYNQPRLFGSLVYKKFKSARRDILDSGNCYATDNFTACVFHLTRVAERGMRALALHLKIRKLNNKVPLEYAEWGPICGALQNRVKELQQKSRGPVKSALLKRYGDAASQADYINEIWRKDVSHARQHYRNLEALLILATLELFTNRKKRKSAKIKENEQPGNEQNRPSEYSHPSTNDVKPLIPPLSKYLSLNHNPKTSKDGEMNKRNFGKGNLVLLKAQPDYFVCWSCRVWWPDYSLFDFKSYSGKCRCC